MIFVFTQPVFLAAAMESESSAFINQSWWVPASSKAIDFMGNFYGFWVPMWLLCHSYDFWSGSVFIYILFGGHIQCCNTEYLCFLLVNDQQNSSYIVSQSVPYVDFWFWLSVLNKRWQIAFFGIVASQILQKQKVHAMFRNMSNQFLLVKCLITSLPENVPSLLLWFVLLCC